ncbi:MAG: hypothetical protein ACP5L1_07420 [Caldivirga sp.]|jgi:hypothetical protein|uniref:hypothetical protein n=1 Tax=Caldivirga sp. TaxID=2080243 RepID=UPI003D12A538
MSRKSRGSKKKRRLFIVAIIAIAIAEVGFIVAYIGPTLLYKQPNAKPNLFSLIGVSLVNISSYATTPSLMNPLVFNGTKPVTIFVTIAPATQCTIPYSLLSNLTDSSNVILVLLNAPTTGLQFITPPQWTNVYYSMQVLNCTAPPNVYLATASWISTGSQIPVGLFNATQALNIINASLVLNALRSNSIGAVLPIVIVAYGNGTIAGYLTGFNALNYSKVIMLVNKALGG